MNNYKKEFFINLIVLIGFVIYYFALYFIFSHFGKDKYTDIYKYISIFMAVLTIIVFEIAYKKNSGTITIYGLETLLTSLNTLISITIISKFNIILKKYIIISCICYIIYYLFKFIITSTINRREYLKSLSDISQIVQKKAKFSLFRQATAHT